MQVSPKNIGEMNQDIFQQPLSTGVNKPRLLETRLEKYATTRKRMKRNWLRTTLWVAAIAGAGVVLYFLVMR